jgi:hypothetical protein
MHATFYGGTALATPAPGLLFCVRPLAQAPVGGASEQGSSLLLLLSQK